MVLMKFLDETFQTLVLDEHRQPWEEDKDRPKGSFRFAVSVLGPGSLVA
jgi:hypothetical protein